MRRRFIFLLTTTLLALAGCDQLGMESASAASARAEADSKAIGAGCRHAARSIEACYEQNKRADKAAVFAGWREMNDYMRENKLEAMPADPPPATVAEAAPAEEEPAAPAKAVKPAKKAH
jgi:hypothetical protein